jgi:hypothetical protein
MMDNFQKNVNVEKLILECKNELDSKNKAKKLQAKPKPKSSGLFSDFNELLTGSFDWSQINEPKEVENLDTKTNEKASIEKLEIESLISNEHFLENQNLNQDSMSKSFNIETNEQFEIDECKNLLRAMFPDVDEEILVDLLITYQNDVDTVTNVLLDSVNLNEFSNNSKKPNDVIKPVARAIDSLKNLCIQTLDKLEIELEKHYEKKESISLDDLDNLNELSVASENLESQKIEETSVNKQSEKKPEVKSQKKRQLANNIIKQETKWDSYKKSLVKNKKLQKKIKIQSEKTLANSINDDDGDWEDGGEAEIDEIDDSVLSLSLTKSFLNSLVQLFGEEGDEMFVNGNAHLIDEIFLNQ